MRNFDHDGLLLAEFQGKLFEQSTNLDCSTAIFLRRFLHSDFVKKLDTNDVSILTLDVNEGLDSIQHQFGNSDYGKEKYTKDVMFWIGYLYRYLSYTRSITTKFAMEIFPYRQLNDVYYTFHTQDPEWCIVSLLDMNNQSEDVFDNNLRMKNIIRETGTY